MNIQKIIRNAWSKIEEDYENDCLLGEGSLQSAFYHHLRNEIKSSSGKSDLMVYPEFQINSKGSGRNQFVDIAIVSLDPGKKNGHLRERVGQIHALIEIKYQFGRYAITGAEKDIEKLEELRKELKDKPYCFMVYICEYLNKKHGEESMLKNSANVKVHAIHENIGEE